MTRVVFVSELPVGYRTGWFQHLHDRSELDVRVLYLAPGQSDRVWEAGAANADWQQTLASHKLTNTSQGFFARLTPSVSGALAAAEPDMVLLPGWAHPACWQAAVWCRRNGVPYGVMFENWKEQSRTRVPAPVTQRVRRAVLAGAAAALPASLRAERFAQGLGAERIRVLHGNVCDVEAAVAASSGVERSPTPTVLYLGRLLEHKGIRLLLETARHLQREGVVVRIAGDGDLRPEVERAATDGRVEFLGPVQGDERFRLISSSHLLLVPSYEEPWGVVVHEALASGTGVIASTEVGCVDDLIEPGVTGAIVPTDAGALAATTLSWLWSGGADADACRAHARRITYATATEELERTVAEVLAG